MSEVPKDLLMERVSGSSLDSTKEASRSGPWTTVLEANLTKGLEFLFTKKDGEHLGAMRKKSTGCLGYIKDFTTQLILRLY